MNRQTTVAAVSTAMGPGAIAVIRMSGPDSMEIAARCWRGKKWSDVPAGKVIFGNIVSSDGFVIDEVLATSFHAPYSFTGEDVMEFSCHGGMFVVQKVLARLIECGAVPAAPGEFTQRAYMNGRMDLTQAEAVMDILTAQSDLALRAAQQQLKGKLGEKIHDIMDAVLELVAHVEAHIDFPDEDISPEEKNRLNVRLENLVRDIGLLARTADRGKMLREGVRTVIAGPPNAGKSSLLNLLLGYDRAIVSDVPGTTRDTVEETIVLGGYALRLIDTAGLRSSGDAIERRGMERTKSALDDADLVLEIVDASAPGKNRDLMIPEGKRRLLVLNKADLGIHDDWKECLGLPFSCKSEEGTEELENRIKKVIEKGDVADSTGDLIAINARHKHHLSEALAYLNQAGHGLAKGLEMEFVALDLREALTELGEIIGKIDTEEILGRIFSRFCIGK